jgi:hypothetical protein
MIDEPDTETELDQTTEPGAAVGADSAEGETAATTVSDAIALSVSGDTVNVSDSLVGAAAAQSMQAEDTLIVLGAVGTLEGDSRVLIDVRSAAVLGVFVALALLLLQRLAGLSGGHGVDGEGEAQ